MRKKHLRARCRVREIAFPTGMQNSLTMKRLLDACLLNLIDTFLIKMKDQTVQKVADQENRAESRSKSIQCSSSLCLFHRKWPTISPSMKSSTKVFRPLSPEQRKQLEALFPALLIVERLLEAELCSGHPVLSETCTVVQLQQPFRTSSLSKRRSIRFS